MFANARATRIKLLANNGFGVWCAARRLNAGCFVWPHEAAVAPLSLTQAQLDALVVGLPWQRLPEMSVITRVCSRGHGHRCPWQSPVGSRLTEHLPMVRGR